MQTVVTSFPVYCGVLRVHAISEGTLICTIITVYQRVHMNNEKSTNQDTLTLGSGAFDFIFTPSLDGLEITQADGFITYSGVIKGDQDATELGMYSDKILTFELVHFVELVHLVLFGVNFVVFSSSVILMHFKTLEVFRCI